MRVGLTFCARIPARCAAFRGCSVVVRDPDNVAVGGNGLGVGACRRYLCAEHDIGDSAGRHRGNVDHGANFATGGGTGDSGACDAGVHHLVIHVATLSTIAATAANARAHRRSSPTVRLA